MPKQKTKLYACYCLQSTVHKRYTYVGITNNFKRRHRQHNGEIKGGAVYTRAHRPWKVLFKVKNLASKREAMQLEWALKHTKIPRLNRGGPENRCRRLLYLMNPKCCERWTKPCRLLTEILDDGLRINYYGTQKEFCKLTSQSETITKNVKIKFKK